MTLARSFLTTLLSGATFALLLDGPQDTPAPPEPPTVRVPSVEILDAAGRVVLELGTTHGKDGSLRLLRPLEGDGSGGIAWLGSSFDSGAEFLVSDPTDATRAGLGLWIQGEPTRVTLQAVHGDGGEIVRLHGGGPPDSPALVVRSPRTGGDVLLSE